MGRQKKDPELLVAKKQQFIDDQRHRNAVDVRLGQGMRLFGLGLIREKLAITRGSMIALNVLVMNLEKLPELLYSFCLLAPASPQQSTMEEFTIQVPKHTDHSCMKGQALAHSSLAT